MAVARIRWRHPLHISNHSRLARPVQFDLPFIRPMPLRVRFGLCRCASAYDRRGHWIRFRRAYARTCKGWTTWQSPENSNFKGRPWIPRRHGPDLLSRNPVREGASQKRRASSGQYLNVEQFVDTGDELEGCEDAARVEIDDGKAAFQLLSAGCDRHTVLRGAGPDLREADQRQSPLNRQATGVAGQCGDCLPSAAGGLNRYQLSRVNASRDSPTSNGRTRKARSIALAASETACRFSASVQISASRRSAAGFQRRV